MATGEGLYLRSRILQRKWVTDSANDFKGELYLRSRKLKGILGVCGSRILQGTEWVLVILLIPTLSS